MKQITSTNFARQYPRLTEPHQVTALGRPIGMWIPTGTPTDQVDLYLADPRYPPMSDPYPDPRAPSKKR